MDIWEGGLDRNVDTGDLVINLLEGRRGERQTPANFSSPPQNLQNMLSDISIFWPPNSISTPAKLGCVGNFPLNFLAALVALYFIPVSK